MRYSARMINGSRCAHQTDKNALGLSSQQEALYKYVTDNGLELIGEHVDVASGTKDDRKELTKALEFCRIKKSPFVDPFTVAPLT